MCICSLKSLFAHYDTNNSGAINVSEVADAYTRMGVTLDAAQSQSIVDNADLSGDGKLELGEFIFMMKNPPPTTEQEAYIKSVFKAYDLSGDGKIGLDELQNACQRMGYNYTEEQVRVMMAQADMDNSGHITYAGPLALTHLVCGFYTRNFIFTFETNDNISITRIKYSPACDTSMAYTFIFDANHACILSIFMFVNRVPSDDDTPQLNLVVVHQVPLLTQFSPRNFN